MKTYITINLFMGGVNLHTKIVDFPKSLPVGYFQQHSACVKKGAFLYV